MPSLDDKEVQNKQAETQKKQAEESAKTYCKICRMEKTPNYRCKCVAGGGGGGGGAAEETKNKNSEPTATHKSFGIDEQVTHNSYIKDVKMQTSQHLNLSGSQLAFDPEIIAKLLSLSLLKIVMNKDAGILRIECKSSLLSPEQKVELEKYVGVILKAFDEFKKQNNIKTDCVTVERDKDGNFQSLNIKFPSPALYDAFVLANKNLLSIKSAPTHSMEEQKTEEHKSSIRPRSPADGPRKPTDWK